MPTQVLVKPELPFKLFSSGKVRDTYEFGDALLMVASDRLSAFDVVFSDGIPYKGQILTSLSAFWFEETKDIIPNHIISTNSNDFHPDTQSFREQLEHRSMLVKKAQRINFECVVRGYIAGGGWKEYLQMGSICGIKLPANLRESDKLPEPIFTPSTKEAAGHDLSITFDEVKNQIGENLGNLIKQKSIEIYSYASEIALKKGIIIADTKMEFGILDGKLILIDELLTPDSSRFWEVSSWTPGKSQASFDKQYVRDYLESVQWNKQPPAPKLSQEIIDGTTQRYAEALKRLSGKTLI